MLRQFELVDLVKAYDVNADEKLLNRAYVYSLRAHGTQKRDSGDPYFSHPVEVAGILTQFSTMGDVCAHPGAFPLSLKTMKTGQGFVPRAWSVGLTDERLRSTFQRNAVNV